MTEKEKLSAPSEEVVAGIVKALLPEVQKVTRTPEGVSTYVYRVETGKGVRYARFLPENATFGVEVLAQRLLTERGVPVPEVLVYLPREPVTGHSLMIAAELPGICLKADDPPELMVPVLREAAAALARLHTLPVEGFGWIDRESETVLKGEHPTYRQFFTEFLEEDLGVLPRCGFSPEETAEARRLAEEALSLLDADRAVLVHGDFCLDHIFHRDGRFTGFIDFGEIRGNHPFFDLGDFWQSDPTPDHAASNALLEGYGQVRPMTARDRRAVILAALAFDLRFVGKKAGTDAAELWIRRLREQLALLRG